MRTLLLILLSCGGLLAQRTAFWNANAAGTATTKAITLTGPSPTSGRTLILVISAWDNAGAVPPTVSSCADTEGTGNTYASDVRAIRGQSGTNFSITFMRASSISGSGDYTITCNLDRSSYTYIRALEVQNIGTLHTSGTNQNGNPTYPPPSATLTTTAASTYLIGTFTSAHSTAVTITPPSAPWAEVYEEQDGVNGSVGSIVDQVVSATGTYNPTWSTSTNGGFAAAVVAYNYTAGGGGGRRRAVVVQ